MFQEDLFGHFSIPQVVGGLYQPSVGVGLLLYFLHFGKMDEPNPDISPSS
jgi:hypothetical protein